jgi:uncharacterized protein (TIGR02284 family)
MAIQTTLDARTVNQLHDLIRMNIDSYRSLNDAGERIDHPDLGPFFRDLAAQRRRQADELQQFVAARSDEEPASGGTAAGTLHRMWMDLRAAINGGDVYVILIEVERAEDRIKDEYQELLDETHGALNDPLHEVLMRHSEQVVTAHDRVRQLRDAMKSSR